MNKWAMTLHFTASSMDALKMTVAEAAQLISKAKVPADLYMNWATSAGNGVCNNACTSEYTCPMEDRIKELRREADRLEEEIRAS